MTAKDDPDNSFNKQSQVTNKRLRANTGAAALTTKEESADKRGGCAPAEAIVEAAAAQAHIAWREGRARRHGDAELVDAAREAGGRVGEGWLVAADGAVEDEAELAPAQLQRRRPPGGDNAMATSGLSSDTSTV